MSKRAGLMLATIAAQITWIVALRRSGLEPHDAPVLRGVLIYGPMLAVAGMGLYIARSRGLFASAELGLELPAWATRRGPVAFTLVLLALFLAGALIDAAAPVVTMLANGMSYEDIVAHLRLHEYRYAYGRLEPPPTTPDVLVHFIKGVVLPPLAEEVPYRALFIPVALSKLSRSRAALASGVVFFLVHWLAYGAQPHPAYFLSGWLLAWVFMWTGLPGAIAVHGGEDFGVFLLGTFGAFAL